MSLTYEQSRARAALIHDVEYRIELDLSTEDGFVSTTTIDFSCSAPGASTFVELAGACRLEVVLNGRSLQPDYDGVRLQLADLAERNELRVRAVLDYVNDGEGMHAYTDPADGERYVVAYLGMAVAQRVYACFDQPDLKAPITTLVQAPEHWTVLANGRQLTVHSGPGGLVHTFARTVPISTYLFVVAAGPWHTRAWEHAGLPFAWHVRASLSAELDRDFDALRALTDACFDHYTELFDEPYAFDSYDQLLSPGHNWGALETPGCVSFRDEYLPRAAPDEGERVRLATVVAHEMAHMWFGDLVTMRWWQDTWLNESFADFMGYRTAAEVGVVGVWPDFTLNRKSTAYIADARRSTHPIAEDAERLVDVDTAFTNFDMITYAKGAAVLRQLETWLGWKTFVAGTNVYLTRHRFANAELADFLDALDSVTDRDVRAWAELYLRTTGYDSIAVTREDGVPVLTRNGSRPHRFTVAVLGTEASPQPVTSVNVEVAGMPARLPQAAGLAVLPNSGDQAYAGVELDELSWEYLAASLYELADPVARSVVWAQALARVRAGLLSTADYLDVVAAELGSETSGVVFDSVSSAALSCVVHEWSVPEQVVAGEQLIATLALQVLRGGDPVCRPAALRRWVAAATDTAALQAALDSERAPDGGSLDQDVRWLALCRLAALGAADDAQLDAELARDLSQRGQEAALRARAAWPTEQAKAWAWTSAMAPQISNRDFRALLSGMWRPGQHELCLPYLTRYVEEGPRLALRSQGFAQVVAFCAPRLPLPLPVLRQYRELLAARQVDDIVLHRLWMDLVDDLDVAHGVRATGVGGAA